MLCACYAICAVALVAPAASADTHVAGTISGTVKEAGTGQPVPLAQVLVEGTTLGTTTDATGRYTIAGVTAGAHRVTARRVGFTPLTSPVTVTDGGVVTLDFTLVHSATVLEQVVTTVTGEQRRVEVGHAVVGMNADSLARLAPVTNFSDLIQARAPGVFSMTQGNQVGRAGVIRIRGLNSFGLPNDPIVVIDGIRVEATGTVIGGGAVNAQTTGGYSGRLADLEPTEIENVEIVKGPSAATLYGTDAANGVVVITTKRGRTGSARWNVFVEQGILQQRLEKWGNPLQGNAYYAWGHNPTTGAPLRCVLVQRAAGTCVFDSLTKYNPMEDPDTRPLTNGSHQKYGLQVSGGTGNGTTYFVSGDLEGEVGTMYLPPADMRFLARTRGTTDIPDWQKRPSAFDKVNLRGNLSAPVGSRGLVTLSTGFISNQTRAPASAPGVNMVGYKDVNDGWIVNQRPAQFYATRTDDNVQRFIGSLASETKVSDWLTARGTFGADLSTNAYGSLSRRGESSPTSLGTRVANALNIARYTVDLGATANRPISPTVSSKTSVGMQYNRRQQRGESITATNLPLGGETIAGAANPLTAIESTIATAVAGAFVEEVVGVRDRLFITGALRFDGGSAFGKNFSLATYPKVGVSWVASDGQRGVHFPGLTSLRLRAALGAAGVQPDPVAALQQITLITGAVDATAAPAAVVGAFGNRDLKPERAVELEGGADIELINGRLRLEATAYQRTTSDALINRPIAPSVIGATTRWENLGSVQNRGLELLLNADLLRAQALSAALTVTASFNKNKLLKLGEGVVVSPATREDIRQDTGYPVYGWWGRQIININDKNGNKIIEPTEFELTPNHFIGPAFPTREATAAPNIGLFRDRVRLNGQLQYRGGAYIGNFQSTNICQLFACRGVNDIDAPFFDQARGVGITSSAFVFGDWVEKADYLMLRELSASVSLPSRVAQLARFRDARLVLSARNVAYLWFTGTVSTPENTSYYAERLAVGYTSSQGPSTYWLLRLDLHQ
jgi:TonB-dependent SusC/RagA subfamily outer membrane receptor